MSIGRHNRNVRTKSFIRQFDNLPARIQELAHGAFRLFLDRPESPALHNHPLDDTRRGRHKNGSRSVRITRQYRAIYVVDGDTNIWYWVGTHESYNIFTGRK